MMGGGEMHGMEGIGGMGGEGMGGMHGGGMNGGGMNASRVGFGVRISQRRANTGSKPEIEAIAVDSGTEDIWAAIGGDLVHFGKDGQFDGAYCLSTSDQAAVKPTTLLVEPNRILVGTDPFGVFEYPRPDKPLPAPPAQH